MVLFLRDENTIHSANQLDPHFQLVKCRKRLKVSQDTCTLCLIDRLQVERSSVHEKISPEFEIVSRAHEKISPAFEIMSRANQIICRMRMTCNMSNKPILNCHRIFQSVNTQEMNEIQSSHDILIYLHLSVYCTHQLET